MLKSGIGRMRRKRWIGKKEEEMKPAAEPLRHSLKGKYVRIRGEKALKKKASGHGCLSKNRTYGGCATLLYCYVGGIQPRECVATLWTGSLRRRRQFGRRTATHPPARSGPIKDALLQGYQL